MSNKKVETVDITLTGEQLDALDWLVYYGMDKLYEVKQQANENEGESSGAWGYSMRLDARYSAARDVRGLIHGLAIQVGL